MEKLAHKLMTLHERASGDAPAAIFGTIDSIPRSLLVRPPFRVAVWPCRSETVPEAAPGVSAVLAWLLERWQDVQVYRLFARLEGEPETYTWTPEKSQFGINDWSIEPLDENVALEAVLNKTDTGWNLVVTIENDFVEDEETAVSTLTQEAATLCQLIDTLPELSEKIIKAIGAERFDESSAVYSASGMSEDPPGLENFLAQLFQWEVRLLLHTWGQTWGETALLEAHDKLYDTARSLSTDFSAWALACATARAMLPGFELNDVMLEVAADVATDFNYSRQPAVILADVFYWAGQPEDAWRMLLEETAAHPASTMTWLRLAALYGRSGRLMDVIDALQSAIENNAPGKALYHRYASVLLAADQYQQEVDEFVLIDPDTVADNPVLREAVAACEEILKLDAADKQALYRRALYLAELADGDLLWDAFRALLPADETGELIRDVVDAMHAVEDVQPAIAALRVAMSQQPDRLHLRTMLALALILDGQTDEAMTILESALAMTTDLSTKADIERLMLLAEDPDFEQYFGDLGAQIAAGRSPTTTEVDFLEEVVEKAPSYVEAHLTLAQAYMLWNDREAALEVLLDAQKAMPDNPDILAELGAVLWSRLEKELAFEYLNRGLKKHPNHISLLTRIGRFLFDNGQIADARLYLSRAEAIDPRDPALGEVRRYIASRAGEFENADRPED